MVEICMQGLENILKSAKPETSNPYVSLIGRHHGKDYLMELRNHDNLLIRRKALILGTYFDGFELPAGEVYLSPDKVESALEGELDNEPGSTVSPVKKGTHSTYELQHGVFIITPWLQLQR
jgi:hypothetical protein